MGIIRVSFNKFFMVLLLLTLMALATIAPADALPALNLGAASGATGSKVTLPVTLVNVAGTSLSAIAMDIGYDAAKLENPTAVIGAAGSAAGKSVINSTPSAGVFRIGAISFTDNSAIGDGVVINVSFDIKTGVAPALITLTNAPSASNPAGAPVTMTGAGGSITTNTNSNTLFSDGFEASGWSTAQIFSTNGSWVMVGSGANPSALPHGGAKMADFNSYTAENGSQTRLFWSSGIVIPSTIASATLSFWMYHDTGDTSWPDLVDQVQVQVSANGTSWTNIGTPINRYDGTTGWAQASIDVSAYKGQTLWLGFAGISAWGNDIYLDDVAVTAQGAASGDFTLAAPSVVTATQGGTGTVTISTTVSGGFNAGVALTATGLPTGATLTFSPTSITAPGSGSAILTLTAGVSTPTGTYTVTVTGTGGSNTHSANISFTVTGAPGAPTIGTATAGNAQATVNFTAPSNIGGAAITRYTVTSNPGGLTATGIASPITVTGLTNGTFYIFTVTATNSVGTGAASAASNAVTAGKASQTVTFGTAPTLAVGGTATVTATATSGLVVSFTTTTPGVCSNVGSTVTGIAFGTCTIAANQSGNATYNSAAQVTQSITVVTPFTFTGSVIDSGNQSVAGAQVYFVAGGQTFSSTTDGAGHFSLKFDPANIPSTLAYWITKAGFIPFAGNLTIAGNSANAGTLTLESLNGNAVVLELVPDVHHLGDSSFSGTINSGFQKATAEGITFSRDFNLSAAQIGAPGATVTLLVKGLQEQNRLLINNQMIGYLNTSPSNGSFGTVSFQVPMNILVSGPNTITIQSVYSYSDYDDFEFTNVVMRLAGGVIPNPTFTVSTNTGVNGSIAPVSQSVTLGNITSFTVTPYTGYTASAYGCGGSLSGSIYTTGAITANCTVSATFVANAKTSQTISAISFSPTTLAVGGSTTASATATSGLVVSFTTTTPGVCSVIGSTFTGITPGTCTIAANQSGDATYNSAAQVTQSVIIIQTDNTAPNLTISTLANNAVTTGSTLNVAGMVSDSDSGVKGLTVNGQAATVVANGSFSIAVTLHDGRNTITTIATDNANNQTTDTRTINLDRTAPLLTITQPADNSATGKTSIAVSGTVEDALAGVTANVNGGSPINAIMTGTDFVLTVNLANGLNTLGITAAYPAGKITSVKRTVFSDASTLTLMLTSPSQDISITQDSITLSGTVSDAVTSATVSITANGQTYTPPVAQDGSFSQDINLPELKIYDIVITATDLAGNKATVQRNIIRGLLGMLGDANGDGRVDIADALTVLRLAVGLVRPTADDYIHADVAPLINGVPSPDGAIDISDALMVLKKVVGLISW